MGVALSAAAVFNVCHQSRFAVQGLSNITLFCGDGINDLAALSAADVGMAVGTTDAIVAASLSTRRGSVAGTHSHTGWWRWRGGGGGG